MTIFSRWCGSLFTLAVLFLVGAGSASATVITFSFADDPTDDAIGRTHIGGVVTGELLGLSENGLNQLPTAIVFTSDISPLSIVLADNTITSTEASVSGLGFDLVNGVVVDASLFVNFTDDLDNPFQFRLNIGYNILHWNGGPTPIVAIGNTDGFEGATYGIVSVVPTPPALAILGFGLFALGMRRRTA